MKKTKKNLQIKNKIAHLSACDRKSHIFIIADFQFQ